MGAQRRRKYLPMAFIAAHTPTGPRHVPPLGAITREVKNRQRFSIATRGLSQDPRKKEPVHGSPRNFTSREKRRATQFKFLGLGLGREVHHASCGDFGLVSSHSESELTATGRRTQMAKSAGALIFDWDKYSPDDLMQKDGSFQFGPALLPALVKTGRAATCGGRTRLRRPRTGSSRRRRA
jgi:hypothetical protein